MLSRKVIQELRPVMDPEEDFMTIVAAEEGMNAADAKRKEELSQAHAKLKSASLDFLSVYSSKTSSLRLDTVVRGSEGGSNTPSFSAITGRPCRYAERA